MYEETKNSIDWKGLFLKVIIAFLVLFIAFKGYSLLKGNKTNDTTETTSNATSNSASSTTFASNMEKLKAAGNNYFKGDKLPTSSAATIVTLNELINNGLIESLTDEDGKTCDGESSYVTAMLENNQYKIKANLVCSSSSSYTLVYMNNDEPASTNSTSTSSKTSSYSQKASGTTSKSSSTCSTSNCGSTLVNTKTNVKQNVTIGNSNKTNTNNNDKYYTVTFDSNGGNNNYSSQTVKENSKATYPGSNIKNACSFNGWYLNGYKYDFDNIVTSNITLTAQYTCNSSYYNYNNDNYDYYDYEENYRTKTTQTDVYTMGWDVYGTNFISIEHTLKLPADLNKSSIKNIRIKDINFTNSLTSSTSLRNFYNYHNSTFIYYNNGWESDIHSTTYLSKIRSNAVNFYTDYEWKTRSEARNSGFDVKWTADYVSNQCSNTFSVNGVSNLCDYGIVYTVTWQYEERI